MHLKQILILEHQVGNLDIFGNLGRTVVILLVQIFAFGQSGLGSLAYSPDTGLAAGLRGNLSRRFKWRS
jgi:hypothetical protein